MWSPHVYISNNSGRLFSFLFSLIKFKNLRLTFAPSEDNLINSFSSREVEHSLKLSYTSWAVAFPIKHDVK